MAAPNEVRVNIRHNILILKTFTVPELRDVTGLNRQSIYTEVRRLEKEDFVSRVGTRKREKGSAGGRPPIVYQLASDPEKRFELLQSVRAFYITAEEEPAELPRPESKHYFIAQEKLKEVEDREADLTQEERTELLALIRKRLEYARQEEEVGEEYTGLIAASLDILEAKAIDTLLGDWDSAIKLLDEAGKICAQSGAEDLVAEVNSYVQTIAVRMAQKQLELIEDGEYAEVEQALQGLRIIKHRFSDLPQIHGAVKQAEAVADMVCRQQALKEKFGEGILQLVDKAWRRYRRRLVDEKEPIERHALKLLDNPEIEFEVGLFCAAFQEKAHVRSKVIRIVGGRATEPRGCVRWLSEQFEPSDDWELSAHDNISPSTFVQIRLPERNFQSQSYTILNRQFEIVGQSSAGSGLINYGKIPGTNY